MKMKKVMKALSLLVAGVLVLACFAGCAGQSGLAQIKEKGRAGHADECGVSAV